MASFQTPTVAGPPDLGPATGCYPTVITQSSHDDRTSPAVRLDPAPAVEELQLLDAYWRTANYLAVGMIYLQDNALLKQPLRSEHIKPAYSATGDQPWPGLHLDPCQPADQEIRPGHDLHVGPGHARPVPVAVSTAATPSATPTSRDAEGLQKFFKMFSFPGRIGSHCRRDARFDP